MKAKIYLRKEILSKLKKKNLIKVLDCYAGNSELWNNLILIYNVDVLSIEKERGKNKRALCGDNLKFLKSLNLGDYHIIDLDAYGIPYLQLLEIFKQKYKGYVVVTAIQSMMGNLNQGLLENYGYSKKMISKCPTLFSRQFERIFFNFLAVNGVKKINIIRKNRKNYLYFLLQ
ncbi:MAG: hypothetical protein GY756_09855 [bacterium]|nr:hypothetical protein [bacterium]